MKIHIGNRRTLKTKCGKTVTRRYWVTVTQQRQIKAGLQAAHGASCEECLTNKDRRG